MDKTIEFLKASLKNQVQAIQSLETIQLGKKEMLINLAMDTIQAMLEIDEETPFEYYQEILWRL